MKSMMGIGYTADFGTALGRYSAASCQRAVESCMDEVKADVTTLVPKGKTGNLRASATVSGSRIQWRVPYAGRQYWTNKKSTQWMVAAKKKYGRKWAKSIAGKLTGGQ